MDYPSLKVVDLKAVLKKRGLPQTGLKQALIDRLRADDAASAAQPAADEKEGEDASEQIEIARDITVEKPGTEEAPSSLPSLETKQPEAQAARDENAAAPEVSTAPTDAAMPPPETADTVLPQDTQMVDAPEDAVSSERSPLQEISQPAPTETPVETPVVTETPAASGSQSLATTPRPEPRLEVPNVVSSNQTSVSGEEVLEDKRKRKRRSLTPPPSAEAVAMKRAKLEEDGDEQRDRPEIKSSPMADTASAAAPGGATLASEEDESKPPPTDEAATLEPAESATLEAKAVDAEMGHPAALEAPEAMAGPVEDGSVRRDRPAQERRSPSPKHQVPPSKDTASTGKDGRFKELFSGSARKGSEIAQQQSTSHGADEGDDRSVEPALHPATPALYIRDFMRPLHQPALKDRLISLATQPGSSPNPDTVISFYLDPIKTHCLVLLNSVKAASRVRSAIHNSVWPDERTRKPLWADFVPEEKVEQWIETEKASSSGPRGSSSKRWEVVYLPARDDEGAVEAELREVGAGGPTLGSGANSGRGVQGAPLGPRLAGTGGSAPADARQASKSIPGPQAVNSGFVALDSLFKSTTAKPKLYFLPVSKDLVDQRLDTLSEKRRTEDRDGKDLRRYTFEDGHHLVDRGPDVNTGVRGGGPPRRGRGRNFTSGRGGWRDNTWRDRRDRW
ncbi:MAG: Cytochrome c1 heme lyase [Chaenotheca gracillima]|nr:MAG: Cytochrome c1 heme lyase [Chaenotheca gracillima]